VSGLVAGAAAGPYNVAKHGVVALMATLEREFRIAKSEHRASVLCPGPINTNIGRNSVRNRRAAAGVTAAPSDSGKKLGSKMSNFLSKGMNPDEVGRIVLDGIVHGNFWIFTHPKLLKLLDEQHQQMHDNLTLSQGRLA
jgi:NAD(P)-dependent dehydrogenase (short-subunit alcohol dehydrogenase family)